MNFINTFKKMEEQQERVVLSQALFNISYQLNYFSINLSFNYLSVSFDTFETIFKLFWCHVGLLSYKIKVHNTLHLDFDEEKFSKFITIVQLGEGENFERRHLSMAHCSINKK